MSTTAQSIIYKAQLALQDLTGVRWSAQELVTYLNDVQRILVVQRPDSNAVAASFVPAAGARQNLPAAAASLIDVQRNTNGSKKAIRKIDQSILDAFNPDWRSITGVTEFTNFIYDPREPNIFHLYPPSAASGGSVEVVYSAYPAAIATPTTAVYTSVTGNVEVQDQWADALLAGVLSKAYGKDAEFGGNAELSMSYAASFQQFTGSQLKASQAVAPQK